MTEGTLEVSAGGVVLDGERTLMVKVKNLLGQVVWTFPKGHLEAGETKEQAALREVREETGWLCRIVKPLHEAHYRFTRQGRPVSKTVHWFLMSPVEKTGESDPHEILDCCWATLTEAAERASYPSDRELLALVKSGGAP